MYAVYLGHGKSHNDTNANANASALQITEIVSQFDKYQMQRVGSEPVMAGGCGLNNVHTYVYSIQQEAREQCVCVLHGTSRSSNAITVPGKLSLKTDICSISLTKAARYNAPSRQPVVVGHGGAWQVVCVCAVERGNDECKFPV